MKMIEPLAVTDAVLTATNLVEDDAPAWDVATSYAVGAQVISIATHSLYVSEVAANLGNDPDADDGSNWTRLSSTNIWKAFDQLIDDQVENDDLISYTITPTGGVSGISFFGLEADAIDIEVSLGATIYNFHQDLVNLDDVEGWYSWLFSGVVREKEALFLDLPYLGVGTEYKIDITGPGAIKVGQIVAGKITTIGVTEWGAQIGILDYSRKDRDSFGNAFIVERRFSRLASFPISVNAERARRVQRKMEDFRATPAVWIGDDRSEYALIIYGFYKSYTHVLAFDNHSRGLIEVEGLV